MTGIPDVPDAAPPTAAAAAAAPASGGAVAAGGQSGSQQPPAQSAPQPTAPSGPNTQPLDLFPQVSFLWLHLETASFATPLPPPPPHLAPPRESHVAELSPRRLTAQLLDIFPHIGIQKEVLLLLIGITDQ